MPNSFEIITSMLEGVNYDQKLFVMNLIIAFNRNHLSEQINNKMPVTVLVLLRKNSPNDLIESIDFYSRKLS